MLQYQRKHPGRIGAQSGVSRLTALVFGLILAAAGYTAWVVVPYYYYYHELQNHFDQMIKVAGDLKDAEIRKRLWYYIEKYELPVDPEDLKIEHTDRGMRISLKYREYFSIPWQGKDIDLWVFDFHAYAEGEHQ